MHTETIDAHHINLSRRPQHQPFSSEFGLVGILGRRQRLEPIHCNIPNAALVLQAVHIDVD